MTHPDPRAARPLSIAWRDWLAGPDWNEQVFTGAPFDAIVVGSGYGGSVAALRLTRKGYRTLLLERGSEYLPGEFPNDFGLVPKSLRVNVPTKGMPIGRAGGLLEFHLGEGMLAVTGNGLGGGSLVNAGVAIEPDADVFAQSAWPAAIRLGLDGGLHKFLRLARRQLRARPWDSTLPQGEGQLRKTAALRRLAPALDAKARSLNITIDGKACKRCGDCASGCNVPGAKQTLGQTYLRRALATGRLQIVTQAEVYRFAPGRVDGAFAWEVQAFATDAQHQFVATRQLFAESQPAATHRKLHAPLLFVCAGTLGSTQLLQRSQARAGGRLAFSPTLGARVSGNGDSLSWVVNEPAPVGGVGRGEEGSDQWANAQQGRPFAPDRIVGPTITAALDLRGSQRPLTERLLIEDGAVPRAIAQVARELLATSHTLGQLDRWWFRKLAHAGAGSEDPLAASAAMAQHSQLLLTMGHDGSPARLVWMDSSDRTAPYLPEPQKLATYQAQQRQFDRLDGRHVHNPLWQALPRSATELMSGEMPSSVVTTVHPLGGCVMGDSPEDGVVDDLGRVWAHGPSAPGLDAAAIEPVGGGRNAPHRWRGLYVLDGSIIPTALGCNPLLTITALAERALHALPDRQASPARRRPARGAARQPEAFPSRDVSQDATLHEVLLADDLRLGGTLAAAFPDGARAKFEAVFPTDDLLRTLTRARHRFDVEARLEITPAAGGQAAVYDCAYGRFDLLPANAASRGPLPLLLVVLQLLMLLPVLGLLLAGAGALLQGDLALGLGRLGAALAVSLSAALLPFWRAVLTWLQLRGLRDIRENVRSDWSAGQLARWVLLLVKQMVHAGEVRTMRYRVPLCLADADRWPQLPRKLLLTAHKRVAYAATIAELTAFVLRRRRRSLDGGQEHVPIRSTFWDQVMDAQVRITADGRAGRLRTLARGVFRMGFETLVAAGAGTGPGGPIRLGMRGDTTNGLLAAAAYPLLFLRFGLKTRMFDFRLPNYSGAPVPDVADKVDAGLRVAGSEQLLGPELHWVDVPRGRSSGDTGDEPGAPLRLPVRRYRPRDAMGKPRRAEVAEGSWEGIPVARAKAVLLLHAFGQSGLTYTFKTTDQNLAECFLAEGYEVWVLEMRMSTRSGYGTDPSTVDQIALHDIPHTVRHMLAQIRAESPTERPLQVAAFAHCIGSAALWMSLLAGRLSHRTPADPKAAPEDVPRLSMLSHAMFSQLHPCVVGGRVPQAKTWLPALLQKVWRHGSVPFAVRGEQGGILLPLLDRLLASLPAPALEQRRPFGNDDAAATCRRIRYIDAQLFRHEHIGDATLGIMNRLFGEANLRLFGQARRFIERGHLVDEDGGSRYVTDRNIRSNLAFPIQLMHGEENELFDIAGAEATFARLGQHHLGWQAQFCTRAPQGKPAFVRVPRYGHLDVLIGDRAHLDVYPDVMAFFRLAYGTAQQAAGLQPATGWRPHPPQIGPFVGWTRRQGADLLVRVSFVPESGAGCEHDPGRIRLRRWTGGHFETWTAVRWHVHPGPYHVMWGDIRLPADAPVADRWQVLTLAPAWGPAAVPLDADDAALDGGLAALTALELAGAEFQLPDATVATLAPRSAVTFGAATCRYPGLGLDAGRIDASVRDFLTDTRGDQAAFTTLLGDQIYADYTAGLVDPLSPLERYYERHALAFRRGALGDLLAAMPVYMTPDDHEWTDNYPSASPLVKEPWPDWSDPNVPFGQTEQRAFRFASGAVRAFQRLQSPLGPAPGPHAWFQHGCTRFFMMDSRSQRQRNHPAIVASMARLARWLAAPQARGALNVIACGSVVLPGLRSDADPADGGASDTWQYAEAQRRELLELLVDLVPGRFLLLSGDYHVSGAVRVKVDDQVVGAAIVAPPLYAPLLYANSTPEAVFVQERIPLSAGRTLHMDVPPGGAMERGSGIGLVSVQPQGEGFAVGFQRQLWVWERGSRRSHDCRIGLGVPQGPCTPLAQAEESGVAQP